MNPKINPNKEYIPKLYGFKIYGKRGSKYYEKVKEEKKKRVNSNHNDNKILSSNSNNEKDIKFVESVMQKFNKISI